MKMHIDRSFRRARSVLALLVVAATATACLDSDEPIITELPGGELFTRYVSLGNSITAGFQSGGINVELQEDAYPVLLAAKAGAPFGVPALAMPGCPPPFVGPLTTERIGTESCGLRVFLPPAQVSNFAVPGADVADATNPIGTGSILNTLLVGGRSQVGAMLEAEPSLVSVWLGSGDALNASLAGEPALLTPLADFQAAYDDIAEAILATPAQDAILIGVVNAAAVAPALQPGAYFWAVANSPQPPIPLQVSDNCAPFTPMGQPNVAAFANLVSILTITEQLAANPGGPVVIDCADDAPFLLNPAEQVAIATRVAEYNAAIAQHADANGWIYIDPTTSLLGPGAADPQLIRKCQGFYDGSVVDAATFAAAVQNTCPGPTAPNFFGAFVSYDGVHPSSAAHEVVADSLASRLNGKHGLSLDTGP